MLRGQLAQLRHAIETVPNNGLLRFYQPDRGERVLVTGIKALNEILVSKATEFVKPQTIRRRLYTVAGNGLLLAEGEIHKAQRKDLMPAFSFRHIKDLYPVFWTKSKELADLLDREINSKGSSRTGVVVMQNWATRATLDIIGIAGMDHDFDSLRDPDNPLTRQYQRMRQAPSCLEYIMGSLLSLFTSRAAYIVGGLPTKRRKEAKEASNFVRNVCRDLIRKKQSKLYSSKADKGVDIISVALRSSTFTNENLVDQMMTFLAAGHGTTSHALQWSVYALCKHESIQNRLRKEIRDNLPPISDRGSTITACDIDGLPYLHAFCNEVLRFYPSVSTTAREALHDTTVAGTYIPKGTMFTIPIAIVNRDVELWGSSASVFDPERWMGQGRANSGGVQNHIGFLTFLHGPRSCIGSNFSRAELACLVAVLVGRFHMELENPNARTVLNTHGIGTAPLDGSIDESNRSDWPPNPVLRLLRNVDERPISKTTARIICSNGSKCIPAITMRGRKPNFVACVHCRQMKAVRRPEQEFVESKDTTNSLREYPEENTPSESQPRRILTEDMDILNAVSDPLVSIEALNQVEWSTSRSIGGVELPASLIQELLAEFYQFYHPSCPLLPSPSTFITYSNGCPFLFWTVMFITLRGRPDYHQLFLSLVDEISDMAYDCIRPKTASFHSMQALLLLCYWPPPFNMLSDDPSSAFVNMATHIGLRLGLHRPGYAKEFDAKTYIDRNMQILRRITWVICFIANVSVYGQTGLPPTVRVDHGLLDILATKPTWLPDTLYCQLHISRQTLNIFLTVGSCELSNTGLLPKPQPVIQLFETELRALESKLSASWSELDYVSFCACRTVLYVLALAAVDNSDDGCRLVEEELRSHWVLQIYVTSMAVVQTASKIRGQFLKTPARLFKTLAGAISFLILLRCSKYHHLAVDSTLTAGIRQGWDLLRGLAITSDDFVTRVHAGLERLSRYCETLKPEDRTQELLSVKTRMGYNVARSIALLIQGKAPRQAEENISSSDPNERLANDTINTEDTDLFLNFDSDDSLLGILPQII
ncbi:hypothetical protein UA08_08812 [Talaromyces atroroseus]|uniref:Xylanolytic transcriptional activator regulatory domain-containing protein n=1 Tax=Talaromyces atroroseus TaxID=1441469 RepID=A0A225AAU2_TALAT|nr:hypothetical protein UA08_08812 [Talaromyces atroroseus]OKL55823.1 hypothetical protein UA08_08812 [Talaromyces atroroseus]